MASRELAVACLRVSRQETLDLLNERLRGDGFSHKAVKTGGERFLAIAGHGQCGHRNHGSRHFRAFLGVRIYGVEVTFEQEFNLYHLITDRVRVTDSTYREKCSVDQRVSSALRFRHTPRELEPPRQIRPHSKS